MNHQFPPRVLLLGLSLAIAATFCSPGLGEFARAEDIPAVAIAGDAKLPQDLVHVLGSGELSHWGRIKDIGLVANRIISCGADRTVRVWSAETGEALETLDAVDGYIAADSGLLVTIDSEQQARVYDTTVAPLKRQLEFSLKRDSKIIDAFASDVGGELGVVFEAEPKVVVLFDSASGRELSRMEFEEDAKKYRFGFRESRRLLAASKREFRVMNVEDGEEITRWILPSKLISSSNSFGYLYGVARLKAPWWLVASLRGSGFWNEESHEWKSLDIIDLGVKVAVPGPRESAWLSAEGVMLQVFVDGDAPRVDVVPTSPIRTVTCLAIERGAEHRGRRAIGYGAGHSTLDDGHVALLDEFGEFSLPANRADPITIVAWSEAGDLLATGKSSGAIAIYSADDWTERKRFRAQRGRLTDFELSPDGKKILSKCGQNIAVFDWQSGESFVIDSRIWTSAVCRNSTLSSPAGHLLAYHGSSGWKLTDGEGKPLASSQPDAPPSQSRCPQGPVWMESEQAYVYFADKAVCRLKLVEQGAAGEMKLELSKNDHPLLGRVLDFSPRDSRVLMLDELNVPRKLRIWDWKPAVMSAIELDGKTAFRGAALLPGRAKVAAILDRDLVVISADGKESNRQRIGPEATSESVMEFSPDGRHLAIVNGDGTCYLFKSDAW